MSGSTNTAKKIADGMVDVDRDDFESVCRLAFDLAEQLDDTEAMIGIANTVVLDQGQVITDGATSHILADIPLLSAHGLAPVRAA